MLNKTHFFKLMMAARPQSVAPMSFFHLQQRHFTRSVKKIILTQDVENLGFAGEICFVKPGRAFNHLVPNGKAMFYSDQDRPAFEEEINKTELVSKQSERRLQGFLSKLKQIKIIFDREPSDINKNVAQVALTSDEVLDQLNKRYNMGIKPQDFKMESQIDTMGEHFVTASFFSEQFQKEFKFFVTIQLREKKKVD